MDPNRREYHYDLPSHTMDVADWKHFPSDSYYPGYFRNQSLIGQLPDSIIINGRGSYKVCLELRDGWTCTTVDEIYPQDSVTQTNTPHAEFHVISGYKYRFRVIGSVTADCIYQLAIQDHNMTVIAVDGYPVKPVVVNTIVFGAGG